MGTKSSTPVPTIDEKKREEMLRDLLKTECFQTVAKYPKLEEFYKLRGIAWTSAESKANRDTLCKSLKYKILQKYSPESKLFTLAEVRYSRGYKPIAVSTNLDTLIKIYLNLNRSSGRFVIIMRNGTNIIQIDGTEYIVGIDDTVVLIDMDTSDKLRNIFTPPVATYTAKPLYILKVYKERYGIGESLLISYDPDEFKIRKNEIMTMYDPELLGKVDKSLRTELSAPATHNFTIVKINDGILYPIFSQNNQGYEFLRKFKGEELMLTEEELKVSLTREEKFRPETTKTLLEEITEVGPEYIAAKKRFRAAAGQPRPIIIDEAKKRRQEINSRPWRKSCDTLSTEEERLQSELIRLESEYRIQRNALETELQKRKDEAEQKMMEQRTTLENSLRALYPSEVIEIAKELDIPSPENKTTKRLCREISRHIDLIYGSEPEELL